MGQFRKFVNYLLGKTSEVQDMDIKDVLLAKVVLDIHRKRIKSAFEMVPLHALKQLHAIDRDNALQATEKRAAILREHREELLIKRDITREVLGEYLPSVSWIKVVKESDDSYIAYEGNGRLVAMQKVFAPADTMMVEVEVYRFRNTPKILRRMNRVRKMNGLV